MSDDKTAELRQAIDTLRDRRAVLRGAAVAGLAGVGVPLLAACGGNSDSSGAASTATSVPRAPISGPSSAPSSSAPTTGGGGPVLGPVSDVPVGGGKVFSDAKIVVTQPAAGQFKAFTAVCTHAGCLVSKVENNTIDCPCHGSKYSVTDGSVVGGPAPAPLAAVKVTVQGGNIMGPAA